MFQDAIGTLEETEQEDIMPIITSWIEQGIAEGELRGRTEGEQTVAIREARSLLSF